MKFRVFVVKGLQNSVLCFLEVPDFIGEISIKTGSLKLHKISEFPVFTVSITIVIRYLRLDTTNCI